MCAARSPRRLTCAEQPFLLKLGIILIRGQTVQKPPLTCHQIQPLGSGLVDRVAALPPPLRKASGFPTSSLYLDRGYASSLNPSSTKRRGRASAKFIEPCPESQRPSAREAAEPLTVFGFTDRKPMKERLEKDWRKSSRLVLGRTGLMPRHQRRIVEKALAGAVGPSRLAVSVEAGCQDSWESKPMASKAKKLLITIEKHEIT